MVSTLPISGGVFTVPGNSNQQALEVTTESINGVQKTVVAQNNNPSPVLANLNYVAAPGVPATIAVSSNTNLLLTNANFNFGSSSDTLTIGSQITPASPQGGGFTATISTNLNMGDGNNILTVQGSSYNIDVTTGSGNDTVNVVGPISNGKFNLGAGSDTLIFGGRVLGARVNLGSDGVRDTIRVNSGADARGLRVTGADSSDVLFIGSTQYNYNQSSDLWVNSGNSNDRIRL